jgi:hypothetical protein
MEESLYGADSEFTQVGQRLSLGICRPQKLDQASAGARIVVLLPKSPTAGAIRYALSHRRTLTR